MCNNIKIKLQNGGLFLDKMKVADIAATLSDLSNISEVSDSGIGSVNFELDKSISNISLGSKRSKDKFSDSASIFAEMAIIIETNRDVMLASIASTVVGGLIVNAMSHIMKSAVNSIKEGLSPRAKSGLEVITLVVKTENSKISYRIPNKGELTESQANLAVGKLREILSGLQLQGEWVYEYDTDGDTLKSLAPLTDSQSV